VASLGGPGFFPGLSDIDQLFNGWLRSTQDVFVGLLFSFLFFVFLPLLGFFGVMSVPLSSSLLLSEKTSPSSTSGSLLGSFEFWSLFLHPLLH
jgi:hypothetical protein